MNNPKTPAIPQSVDLLDGEGLSSAFKALGHPARIAILKAICPRERTCCGEIVEALPLAQSTVSQHLQILRDAGLIKGEIDGRRSCYCIDPAVVGKLAEAAAILFTDLQRAAEECIPASQETGEFCVRTDNQENQA